MSKRMRYVYPPNKVASVWASQSQPDARNQRGNFYFIGVTIYSYGRHFPIARLIKKRDRTIILFTSRDYSTTTAKHKSIVWSACHKSTNEVVIVPDLYVLNSHKENLAYFKTTIEDLLLKIKRSLTHTEHLISDLRATCRQGNAYLDFFKLKRKPFTIPDNVDGRSFEEILKMAKERTQTALERRELEPVIKTLRESYIPPTGEMINGLT